VHHTGCRSACCRHCCAVRAQWRDLCKCERCVATCGGAGSKRGRGSCAPHTRQHTKPRIGKLVSRCVRPHTQTIWVGVRCGSPHGVTVVLMGERMKSPCTCRLWDGNHPRPPRWFRRAAGHHGLHPRCPKGAPPSQLLVRQGEGDHVDTSHRNAVVGVALEDYGRRDKGLGNLRGVVGRLRQVEG